MDKAQAIKIAAKKRIERSKNKRTAREIMEEFNSQINGNISNVYSSLSKYYASDSDASDCLQDLIIKLMNPEAKGGYLRLKNQIESANMSKAGDRIPVIKKIKKAVKLRKKTVENKKGKYQEYMDYFTNGEVINSETKTELTLEQKIEKALNSDEYLIFRAYWQHKKTPESIAERMKLEAIEVKKAIHKIGKKIKALDLTADSYDLIMAEIKKRLNDQQLQLFNEYYVNREKQTDLADKYGISQPAIHKRIAKIQRIIRGLNKKYNIEAIEQSYVLPNSASGMPANWYNHKEDPSDGKVLKSKEKARAIEEIENKPKPVSLIGEKYKVFSERLLRRQKAIEKVKQYLRNKGIIWGFRVDRVTLLKKKVEEYKGEKVYLTEVQGCNWFPTMYKAVKAYPGITASI